MDVAESQVPVDLAVAQGVPGHRAWRPRMASQVGVICACGWLVVVVGVAVFAPVLPLYDPVRDLDTDSLAAGPSSNHLLGTDQLGRDVLSRMVWGGRVALVVGVGSVVIGALIGTLLGLISGYLRGRTEAVVLFVVDTILAFPALVLAMALVTYVGPSVLSVTIAIGVVAIPTFARIARGSTLAFSQREFVLAARSLGFGKLHVLGRELLPNVLVPVATYMMLLAGLAIVTEGSLGFLGLSVAPPAASWGGMVAAGRMFLARAPHLTLFPSLAIFLTVSAFNTLGRHAQARFDIRVSAL
jgi:peptide/nickel transport system permease protein